jgi:xanthine dehydrogenase FAD-binding subunit
VTKVFLPRTLNELWNVLDAEPEAKVYAGGTDFLVGFHERAPQPASLVCIERISEIKGVSERGDWIWIGAATTHRMLLTDSAIREHAAVLALGVSVLASPPVRNMGTIGGNIVNASPAGDSLPPLYVLGAEVEIESRISTRRIPIQEFILGPGVVDLRRGEIVTGLRVRKASHFAVHHYEKVGRRKAQACSIVGMAALIRLSESKIVEEIRIAWGSVGPTVVTIPDVEHFLVGKPLGVESLSEAMPLVSGSVSPIDDVRATAEYRREVAARILLRLARYA